MVGILESVEYIIYVATSAVALAQMLCALGGLDALWCQPILCLLFYISALAIHIKGGFVFWRVNFWLCFISLGLILIYVFGNFANMSFSKNAGYAKEGDETTGSVYLCLCV